MEKTITFEELRKRSLFVGVPCYGGKCDGMFTKSMCDLSVLCTQYQIQLNTFFLFNESLITRARNYIVDEFMRSGFTHLMFIDSDIGFNAQDVVDMLALVDDDSPYDVIGGCYPKKCITWEKIKAAVDAGIADENPNQLENFVGDFVFNLIMDENNKNTSIPLSEPAEVAETGTGFMMIRKSTFEKFNAAYPELLYKPDHVRSEHFDGSRQIMAYFDTIICPKSNRYLSEDYMFCQYVREMGGKVWVCPWMSLKHVGAYIFGGSLAAMASIGASATADESVLKHNKRK
jgi:hypothetical protein